METPRPESLIVCHPIIIFTQEDANKIVGWTPYKPLKGHQNAVLVTATAMPDEVMSGAANVTVVHHSENHVSKKHKVVGAWNVRVRVSPMDYSGGSNHIYRIILDDMQPPSALNPEAESPAPDAKPEPNGRNSNVEVPAALDPPKVTMD